MSNKKVTCEHCGAIFYLERSDPESNFYKCPACKKLSANPALIPAPNLAHRLGESPRQASGIGTLAVWTVVSLCVSFLYFVLETTKTPDFFVVLSAGSAVFVSLLVFKLGRIIDEVFKAAKKYNNQRKG